MCTEWKVNWNRRWWNGSSNSLPCPRWYGILTKNTQYRTRIGFIYDSNLILGCASYISWDPLDSNPVNLPGDAVFVVAHSLVEANKAATQDFNDRVKGCTIAAQV